MSQPRRFHLFNCDNIYELSVVEDLLNAAKAKIGFKFSVEKHNFTLSEMSELSTKTIPEMKMDLAIFVVHAHESVLYINNDNLELGYAEVYRALMQAAGNFNLKHLSLSQLFSCVSSQTLYFNNAFIV